MRRAVSNPYPFIDSQGLANNNFGDSVGTTTSGTAGYYDAAGATPRVSLGAFLPNDLTDGRLASGSENGVAGVRDLNSSMTTLFGKLSPSDPFSITNGVSPDGQTFVGQSGSTAFIFDTSFGMRSLNSLLDPTVVGWTIINAMDANDNRQIVGTGIFGGVEQAIILTPFAAVPEPTSHVGAVGLFGFYQLR